ncbi:hypothetical protein GC088_05225 [Arthrobacter sp. JZ12]|uniref:hypothetical protein n=1 Tax=Arthrobacter sp. JZ12 TaxID=2654190 RepID=UPI002B49FEBB|nr:hypothetical protein [Arthrobacter sp. JZ12]WRH24539.1 hypothetical protein GC088_05225 [Arthrobacter sp. JZ12]
MDFSLKLFQENLTRRQFGLLLGGGAVLVAAGGTYGVIAHSESSGSAPLSFATPFGMVILRRAGRFARLDAQGRRAPSNLAMAASHFSGHGGATAHLLDQTPGTVPVLEDHSHGGSAVTGGRRPLNLTWAHVVVLEVEVRNDGAAPVLFSPGQLRLKLAPSEVTVTPQDSDHPPGTVQPHAIEPILISYLAPEDWTQLELEYTDDVNLTRQRLALPPLTGTAVLS